MDTINELSEIIIGLCIKIHKTLGVGLFESVYETVLCYELSKNEIPFVCQHPIPVYYENVKMDVGFRADLIIDNPLAELICQSVFNSADGFVVNKFV